MQSSKLLPAVTMVLLLIVSIQFDVKTGIKSAQAQDSENPLTAVRQGQCEKDEKFAIAVHGGVVFSRSLRKREASFVQSVLAEAQKLLASGAHGIDVVEAVIASMENSGVFNAGKGSIANEAGVIEMDALIMDGLLPKVQDKCIVRLERIAQMGHELRRPEADYLRDGIYELRASYKGVHYRMLYFFPGEIAVISHGLVKEKAIPPKEIARAVRNKKLFMDDPESHTYKGE